MQTTTENNFLLHIQYIYNIVPCIFYIVPLLFTIGDNINFIHKINMEQIRL